MGKMKDLSIDIENAIRNKEKFPAKFGEYLPDAMCFYDMPKKSEGEEKERFEEVWGKSVECPVCHGYGGWRLTLFAYKNNGQFPHFSASCSQCNGWGVVEAGGKDVDCIHERRELSYQECRERGIDHWGMCYHVYECKKCGNITAQDSSD